MSTGIIGNVICTTAPAHHARWSAELRISQAAAACRLLQYWISLLLVLGRVDIDHDGWSVINARSSSPSLSPLHGACLAFAMRRWALAAAFPSDGMWQVAPFARAGETALCFKREQPFTDDFVMRTRTGISVCGLSKPASTRQGRAPASTGSCSATPAIPASRRKKSGNLLAGGRVGACGDRCLPTSQRKYRYKPVICAIFASAGARNTSS